MNVPWQFSCVSPSPHFFPSPSLHTDCSVNINKYTHTHTYTRMCLLHSQSQQSLAAVCRLPSALLPSRSTCQIGKLKVKQQQPQQQPQTQDIAEAKQTLTAPAKFRYPSLTKKKVEKTCSKKVFTGFSLHLLWFSSFFF